jgi:hypothetical protein
LIHLSLKIPPVKAVLIVDHVIEYTKLSLEPRGLAFQVVDRTPVEIYNKLEGQDIGQAMVISRECNVVAAVAGLLGYGDDVATMAVVLCLHRAVGMFMFINLLEWRMTTESISRR